MSGKVFMNNLRRLKKIENFFQIIHKKLDLSTKYAELSTGFIHRNCGILTAQQLIASCRLPLQRHRETYQVIPSDQKNFPRPAS